MPPSKRVLNVVVAPLILAGAAALVISMVRARKDPPSRIPAQAVPRVAVMNSSPADATPAVRSYGNVRTFYEARLSSLVSGEVIEVAEAFQPGRAVARDQALVRIDPADYHAVVAERESTLATNQQALAEEETRSRLARPTHRDPGSLRRHRGRPQHEPRQHRESRDRTRRPDRP